MRVFVDSAATQLPDSALASRSRRIATRDHLARRFRHAARGERDIAIDAGRQTVLDRSACLLVDGRVELRFTVNLPARGRRILGRQAERLLVGALPEIITEAAGNLDLAELEEHAALVEDQDALRKALDEAELLAFVGNGSVLPRRSGIDDRPLADAVPFQSPPSLEVEISTPNAGPVRGMGVPRGITLIVGGGYHGKSTLLRAIESGVWNHLPGDGRELVVAQPGAVKIRAEDGRVVHGVDISAFINGLPGGRETSAFSTELASGSTSQAAALVEAVEGGASALLVDEDTSATNFMIRDRRMQALVARTSEPITPFVDRIRELRDAAGVSTVLVMGGSGDYFDHADVVVQMDYYLPVDVTEAARAVAAEHRTGRCEEHETPLTFAGPRALEPGSLHPERNRGRWKIQARGTDTLVFGRNDVDLRAVEQLEDPSQVRAIGWLLGRLSEFRETRLDPVEEIRGMLQRLDDGDWDWLSGRPDGDLARPRLHEVLAALNRMRQCRMLPADVEER
jgi:predicted ABC-class ATPase